MTAIENAPVTGSLPELVMVTVGAAVFAVMENWSAAASGFPELSCAAPAAMSTVTVPETSGVIVAVCRSRGSPPAAASPDTAPPESSGSYRAFGGRLQGCPRGVSDPGGPRRSSNAARAPAASATRSLSLDLWHFICGKPVWSRRRGTRGGGRRVCHGAAATSAPVDHASRTGWGRTARPPCDGGHGPEAAARNRCRSRAAWASGLGWRRRSWGGWSSQASNAGRPSACPTAKPAAARPTAAWR